jgi:hypothetical protein
MKTANQLYRESNSNLSFKEWLTMQKNMGKELPNPANEMEFQNIEGKNWLGIPTPIIVVGVLVLGGLLYLKYRKK